MCVYVVFALCVVSIFFEGYGDHRDLHVLTHSFPTRRSSDLTKGFGARACSTCSCRSGTTYKGCRMLSSYRVPWSPTLCIRPIVLGLRDRERKRTRLNSSHSCESRKPASA